MEIKTETKIVTYIEYDGIKFYRDGKGYWLSSHLDGKPKRLHVYVWEKFNGEIPKGYHVHHIDGDTDNNEIENLALLSQEEHLKLHGSYQKNKAIARKNIRDYAQPAAVEWHKSDTGREWHKIHYLKNPQNLHGVVEVTCAYCGKTVTKGRGGGGNKYCSNACKSAYRRMIGADNVSSVCEWCGKEFLKCKYQPTRFCSVTCASRYNASIGASVSHERCSD